MSKLLVLYVCLLVVVVVAAAATPEYRPVVLMHGIMASAGSMSTTKGWIEQDFPGIYVHNAEVGDGVRDSLLMNMNEQVRQLAASLRADERLSRGFNMVCHSQGGLLCRAYVERFNDPPVYNLMSWAGPNSGYELSNSVCVSGSRTLLQPFSISTDSRFRTLSISQKSCVCLLMCLSVCWSVQGFGLSADNNPPPRAPSSRAHHTRLPAVCTASRC
jgi:Palmitoyl protein thioesterase